MPEELGRLKISGERGGTISEISQFLSDLENAYIALYAIQRPLPWSLRHRLFPWILVEFGYPSFLPGHSGHASLNPETIPPSDRLVLVGARIESPGFWEFAASLNPLQQIREYLNDRHRRRQDRDFREAAERERLALENELLRKQIEERETANIRLWIETLRNLGISDEEIKGLLWSSLGAPLSRLGRHQDTRLIGGAE